MYLGEKHSEVIQDVVTKENRIFGNA